MGQATERSQIWPVRCDALTPAQTPFVNRIWDKDLMLFRISKLHTYLVWAPPHRALRLFWISHGYSYAACQPGGRPIYQSRTRNIDRAIGKVREYGTTMVPTVAQPVNRPSWPGVPLALPRARPKCHALSTGARSSWIIGLA